MPIQFKEIHNKFLLWRDEHIKERHFLLFVCFIVGILTAFAAYLLKLSIEFIQVFLTENFSQVSHNYSYLLFQSILQVSVNIFGAGLSTISLPTSSS
jgi:CIC family chloride channel protein